MYTERETLLVCGTSKLGESIYEYDAFSFYIVDMRSFCSPNLTTLLCSSGYLRQRDSYMPQFRHTGRARSNRKWSSWPLSRIPIKVQPDFSNPPWNWEYDFSTSYYNTNTNADCIEFVAERRLHRAAGVRGYGLFSSCDWLPGFPGFDGDHYGCPSFNPCPKKVELAMYASSLDIYPNRHRKQVLLWTQQNRKCCVDNGRSDSVTQGIWLFQEESWKEVEPGREVHLPEAGEL